MTIARSIASSVASSVAGAVTASSGGGFAYDQVRASAVGFWPLQDDAASTNVNEIVANADGTLAGGVNTADISTTGPSSNAAKALHFNGTTQYVGTIGDGTTVQFVHQTAIGTVAMWVKPDANDTRYYWFGNSLGAAADNGFFFGIEYNIGLGDNALRFAIKKNAAYVIDGRSPNDVIGDTDWHHVAATFNAASGIQFYVDGAAVGTTTYITAFTSVAAGGSTRLLRIGATNHTSLTLPFDGAMADVGIFDRVLSIGEIGALAAV